MGSGPEAPSLEVVYARRDRQRVVTVPLEDGMTALMAVQASGLLEDCPEIATLPLALGIYGRRVEGSQPLRPGDRVEIYRPLEVDPREARRRAAQDAGRRRRQRAAPRPG